MITITESAAERVKSILKETGKADSYLRLYVQGGGCSGLQYGLSFEENTGEKDMVAELHGVKIVLDPKSALYLAGSEVDFTDNLMGGGFQINNPNAKSSCGCGSSFSA